MKSMKEWPVEAKWGKIAMVSWGDPANPPVLLVHGYMDSAATFIFLVEQLPDNYYYVALDLPGHGQSDPFPGGAVVSLLHMVEVVHLVVDYMRWEKFVYISHSMAVIIGMFYNHSFPGYITRMVLIDPAPSFFMHHLHNTPRFAYEYLFELYYSFFERWNAANTKILTMEEAVNLSHRTRTITEEQARIIIPRSLMPAGDGKFTLTLVPKMKRIASADVSPETLITVLTQKTPPLLIVEASINICAGPGKDFAAKIIQKCLTVRHSLSVTVEGSHDVHITNPDGVAVHVVKFLKSDFDGRLVRALKKTPPLLIVEASINICAGPGKDFAAKIIQKCLTVRHSLSVTVEGSHDVHITNPDGVAKHVVRFLKSDFDGRLVKGKL